MIRILFGFGVFCGTVGFGSLPPVFLDKIYEVNDFTQTSAPHLIPFGGKPHCAPAAVSNSLMWLSRNGFPSLVLTRGPEHNRQARLIAHLGRYMKTTNSAGTSPHRLFSGLQRHLKDRQLSADFSGQGWRNLPEGISNERRHPDIDWIKKQILGDGSVWLLVGWYRYDAIQDHFHIVGGHYLTVVGYGTDRNGIPNESVLVVHDSSDRTGFHFSNQYVVVETLTGGTIDGERSAKGALSLVGEMKIKSIADLGIVEGAYSANHFRSIP